ncbi:MAG: 30S ribosomal protein S6 [Candidatus Latescibacterota bacterium]
MRKYELVCIFDPQVGENRFDEMVAKYEGLLKSGGAEVANIDRWGMRQLAYTSPSLRKRRQGYYVLYQFLGEPGVVDPLEDELRIDEAVLRHLVTSVEGDFLRVPELAPESILEPRPPAVRDRERGGRPGRREGRDGREEGRDGRPREGRRERTGREGAEAPSQSPAPAEGATEGGGEEDSGS